MKTFKPQGAELVEEASVSEPVKQDPLYYNYYSCSSYEDSLAHYQAHIASLARYTINPEDWKGITQVKEGEFEIMTGCKHTPSVVKGDLRGCPDCYLFAIPKREEDLFKTAMDNDWSAKKAIAYILEHYTLTKK
jgi:hypothetical protein